MSLPLRVVAVVSAPLDRVERAVAVVRPPVRSRVVQTPAGVLLTLERRAAGWRRAATVRSLEQLLARVLDELPVSGAD